MQEIGIELITRGEKSLENVLISLSKQKFTSYEVTCVNSSSDPKTSELLQEFGVKEVAVSPETKHLKARYLAHMNSSGHYRFLLDSTRPLEDNALETLTRKYGMFQAVCIREGSIGQGFWVNQSDRLRLLSEKLFLDTLGQNVAYLLPRFYHAEVLDRSFQALRKNIDGDLFNSISYGEHHLIYEAAALKKDEIIMTDEVLLRHFEDSSAKAIFRKYRWYGQSQKTLNKLSLDTNAKKLSSHRRPYSLSLLIPSITTIPIRSLRGFAFLLGYLT